MSTITAVLEADADGTLHLPLPLELRTGKVMISATLQAAPLSVSGTRESRSPLGAFLELRKSGGLRRVIPDPAAWQREQRTDRSLPGRP